MQNKVLNINFYLTIVASNIFSTFSLKSYADDCKYW